MRALGASITDRYALCEHSDHRERVREWLTSQQMRGEVYADLIAAHLVEGEDEESASVAVTQSTHHQQVFSGADPTTEGGGGGTKINEANLIIIINISAKQLNIL